MSAANDVLTRVDLRLFNDLISARFGITFPEHKRRAFESRLRPRLQALGLDTFRDYYQCLEGAADPDAEWGHLAELVTNNETFFFREIHPFESVFDEALESLKEDLAVPGFLRLLCAGCSSGEEAYTLSLFAWQSYVRLAGTTVAIDAFDLDRGRIEMARRAEYGRSSLRSASPEQVQRYFNSVAAGRWALKPVFRAGVHFAQGNILDLGSFQGLHPYDVLFCRNVLIYFSEAAIRRAVELFASVLRPGGLLFVGASESIIGLSEQFETVRFAKTLGYRRVRGAGE